MVRYDFIGNYCFHVTSFGVDPNNKPKTPEVIGFSLGLMCVCVCGLSNQQANTQKHGVTQTHKHSVTHTLTQPTKDNFRRETLIWLVRELLVCTAGAAPKPARLTSPRGL